MTNVLPHLRARLHELEKKEKRIYEALAALLNFLLGEKKHELKTTHRFSSFKKTVLTAATEREFCRKSKSNAVETKFNVKHYERAMQCASDPTYRDMAIQAASKDLNQEAMEELIMALCKDCREASRLVKEAASECRSITPEAEAAVTVVSQ